MGRPSGTKNIMRTPEEKEQIVLEYLNGQVGQNTIADSYGLSRRLFQVWVIKYRKEGIEGLKSKTGKQSNQNPNFGKYDRYPYEVDKLKQELLKKDIEIERLKKGYQVKGVGVKKEYVTTFDANMK